MLTTLHQFNLELEPWVCAGCGYCRAVCPVYEQIGWESVTARGKIFYLKQMLQYQQTGIDTAFAERSYQCTLCGHCQEVCQTKIDTPRLWQAIRTALRRNQLLPSPIEQLDTAIRQEKNIFNMPSTDRLIWSMMIEEQIANRINRHAEIGYFIGCVSAYTGRIATVPEAIITIFDTAKIDYTILGTEEWCCGNPIFLSGYEPVVIDLVENNLKKFAQLGVKTIVTNCAGCYRAFKVEYPRIAGRRYNIEVLHITQFIWKLIEQNMLPLGATSNKLHRVVYHDPCELGRHCGVYNEPRWIIQRLPNIQLVEFSKTRREAKCCGGGGLLKATFPELAMKIAENRITEALQLEVPEILSCCVACELNFNDIISEKKYNIIARDVVECVVEKLTIN